MPLGAGHGLMALLGCFVLLRVRWVAFPAPGGCHFGAVFAVGTVRRPGEHAVKSGQVYSWLGDQGGQFADEIQRIEDDVGRTMPTAFAALVWCF